MQIRWGFQVAEVRRPLISVKKIMEKGNHVCFGPKDEDNYIINKSSGDKMMLNQVGKGSYVMEVSFTGGETTQIIVDSGAEDSVCPWAWGEQFGIREPERWLNLRNASGDEIPHYGSRDVFLQSTF